MKKISCNANRSLIIFLFLFFSSSFALAQSSPNKALETRLHKIYEQYYTRPVLDSDWFQIIDAIEVQKHIVQPGDTLWGISKIYFGDGNYWSKLWSVNKTITNPHLIFVGDVIHFHTGSFRKAPGIDLEKNSTLSPEQNMASNESSGATVAKGSAASWRKPTPLPSIFKERPPLTRKPPPPVVFIPRPKMHYRTKFVLTRDLLSQEIDNLGYVDSIGEYRTIIPDRSIIIINSDKALTEGTTYSILEDDLKSLEGGYQVHVLGTATVQRKIDDSLYEALVIQQFQGIVRGAIISSYQPQVVDMEIGDHAPTEAPVHVISGQQSMWSSGESIFLKMTEGAAVAVGDVLKINNKFSDRINFYVGNGAMKIVAISPPYATGIVIYSQEHVRENSISSPIQTSWSLW
ncbi:MAG: LysM peptidoglycan-binding domain-containing protein [Bdellovibrionaceae bacterium]|nr:LysM peptidoglycan-binding domain-containing protein [Pseudobdellovibrionaceae bacterium]